MSDKKKHIDAGPENFQRYSGNRMTEKERNAFERMLEQDPFAAEAAEGFSRLSGDELAADLQELKERTGMRKSKSRRWILYSAAAAVISLLIISTFFLKLEVPREKSLSEKIADQDIKKQVSVTLTDTFPGKVAGVEHAAAQKQETEPLKPGRNSEEKKGVRQKQTETAKAEEEVYAMAEVTRDENTVNVLMNQVAEQKEASTEEQSKIAVVAREDIPLPSKSATRANEVADGGIVSTVPVSNRKPRYPESSFRISGTIYSSEDGSPIPGVAVVKKGTTSGAITDMDGNFHISFDGKDTEPVLEARLVGLNPEEVKVSARDTTLKIEMEPSLTAMDEVVVIGYGISDARNESGSVTIIRPDDDIPPVYNPACPVTGRVAFEQYIERNMVFPDGYPELSRAVVILRFTVGDNGRPMAIEVVKSPGVPFSVEAIRLLNEGPDWLPPTRDEVPINERQRLRLVFNRTL
ncbi:MAG: carboxypeptidase-like regulatory domain-containing protein [Bacteroidota bacterium]